MGLVVDDPGDLAEWREYLSDYENRRHVDPDYICWLKDRAMTLTDLLATSLKRAKLAKQVPRTALPAEIWRIVMNPIDGFDQGRLTVDKVFAIKLEHPIVRRWMEQDVCYYSSLPGAVWRLGLHIEASSPSSKQPA